VGRNGARLTCGHTRKRLGGKIENLDIRAWPELMLLLPALVPIGYGTACVV
jgi:hypothetical protein